MSIFISVFTKFKFSKFNVFYTLIFFSINNGSNNHKFTINSLATLDNGGKYEVQQAVWKLTYNNESALYSS